MEHWAYHTDDDEHPKKESGRDASQTQQSAAMEHTSADFSKPHQTEAAAITNAPGDPSWANLEPHPENARPPPREILKMKTKNFFDFVLPARNLF